jgi:hypothetical protein
MTGRADRVVAVAARGNPLPHTAGALPRHRSGEPLPARNIGPSGWLSQWLREKSEETTMTNPNQQNPNQGGQKDHGQGHGSERGGQQQQQGGQKGQQGDQQKNEQGQRTDKGRGM